MDPISLYNNISNSSGISQYTNVTSINKDSESNSGKQYTAQNSQPQKGEIIDIKQNEITILLDDNTKITAKLYDTSNLNIGQYVKFHVQNTSTGAVIDKIEVHEDTQNTLIFKALEAANLPATEKNITIATELLKNNMALDKNTIQNIKKQSFINKSVSVETLVLMNKHNIPYSSENAEQFQKYCHYEHRIIKELDTIAKTLPDFIDSYINKPESTSKDIINYISNLIKILTTVPSQINESTSDIPNLETATYTQLQNEQNNEIIQQYNTSTPYSENPIVASAYLYPDAPKELHSILSSFNVDSSLLKDILTGTASLRNVASTILKCIEEADEIDYYKIEQLNTKTANAYSNIALAKDIFKSPVVQNILDKYAYLQRDNSELSSFMNNFNRAQLISKLRDVPNSERLCSKIWTGDISSDKLLENISEIIKKAPEKSVKSLITSSQYKSIITETLLNKWTISPNDLTKDKIIEKTYHTIYDQISRLDSFVKSQSATGANTDSKLEREFNGTKNNIDFINTLNEMLTYVQLPLKFRNQNVHSDLYVLTNKKKLSRDNANINILLHLDMEYLGSMDININLVGNNITAKFNVTDEDTKDLLTINMEELEFSLLEKGFLLNSDVILQDKTVDLINDFIDKDSPTTSIKRYTFDVRT